MLVKENVTVAHNIRKMFIVEKISFANAIEKILVKNKLDTCGIISLNGLAWSKENLGKSFAESTISKRTPFLYNNVQYYIQGDAEHYQFVAEFIKTHKDIQFYNAADMDDNGDALFAYIMQLAQKDVSSCKRILFENLGDSFTKSILDAVSN